MTGDADDTLGGTLSFEAVLDPNTAEALRLEIERAVRSRGVELEELRIERGEAAAKPEEGGGSGSS